MHAIVSAVKSFAAPMALARYASSTRLSSAARARA